MGGLRSGARTALIGRDDELALLEAELAGARLVTLTGPGGAGKTRLAQAVFHARRTDVQSCWVDLAQVQAPELVGESVAAALGAQPGGTDAVTAVVERLGEDEFLLVLDNCEHLVTACAELVDVLLDSCPGLQVLATSRDPLAIAGEAIRRVPPLSAGAAAELFAQRARAMVPDFAITGANTAAIGQLCRRLAGWPLSIELAAARMRVLTVDQIVTGLDDVFALLSSGSRGPARHQSLHATLDWSHDLLTGSEQLLFRRLGTFPGSFDLAAARAVAADELPGGRLLDVLSRLVDRSLVSVQHAGPRARYRLLGPIRAYALERLDAAGESEQVADAHLRHYCAVVERAEPLLVGAEQVRTLDELEAEASNLRTALSFARDHARTRIGMRLAAGLWRMCYLRGHYREGRYWLDWAATVDPDADAALRAKALRGGGSLALLECDYPAAVRRLEAALQLYRDAGDDGGTATVLQVLGSVAREQGRYGRAEALHQEALELFTALGDDAGKAQAEAFLAFVAWLQCHWTDATEHGERALAAARQLADPETTAWALTSLGTVAQYTGDHARAAALLAEAHELSVAAVYPEGVAWTLHERGLLGLRRDDRDAEELLLDSLVRHRELGDRWRQASVLTDLAAAAVAHGRLERGAALLGAAASIRDDIGTVIAPCEQADHDRVETAARTGLGPDGYAIAWTAGRDSIDAALAITGAEYAPSAGPVGTPAARATELRVRMLGAATVRRGARELSAADWGYGKPRELCFLLASSSGLTKQQIGLALWPELDGTRLRNAFHTALRELRRALGDPGWVVYGDGRYALDRSRELRCDVDAFESALRAARRTPGADALGHLQQAIAAYGGPFLPDADAEWALERGAQLHRDYGAALAAAGRILVEAKRPGEAVELYQRAVEHDPLDETAHRRLMRCLAAIGEPARAVLVYRELSDRLRSELGIAPAPETAAIFRRLTAT